MEKLQPTYHSWAQTLLSLSITSLCQSEEDACMSVESDGLHENGAANIEIVYLLLSLVTGIYCFSSDSFSCVYVQKIAKQSAPRASIWTISKNPTAAKDGLWQYKQWREYWG